MIKKLIAILPLLMMPLIADARKRDSEYYLSITSNVLNYVANEPEADTDSETVVYPLVANFDWRLDRISRVIVSFKALDLEIAPGNDGIGLDVEGYQLASSWQRKFRVSRSFKPWFGIGLMSSFFDYTNRVHTDSDGFLIEMLDDRKEATEFSVLFTSNVDIEISEDWFVDIGATYEQPIDDGLSGLGFSAGLKYRF